MPSNKPQRTQHANEPLFEAGKAYRMTDGSKYRIYVLEVSTVRAKTDEHEFNQHTYRAVTIERGDKLTIRESALCASVQDKPCKHTADEVAKYAGSGEPGEAVGADLTPTPGPADSEGMAVDSEPPAAASVEEGHSVASLAVAGAAVSPRVGVFIFEGMSVYQVGRLVVDALLECHAGIVVSAPGVRTIGGREVKR